MVCTSIASQDLFYLLQKFVPASRFHHHKFNQRRPLPSREFIPPSCWISWNSAVHFHCSVCTSHKKYLGLWHWHWRRCCHHWSCIYLRCFHPMCFRPLYNCSFKLQFLPGFQLLIWEGDHAHVCFCGTCLFIYSFHAAPYQPFKNRVDQPFHLPILWLYPCFHNSVQILWRFSSSQKIGPRLLGSMTTIGPCVVVFPRPAQCQVKTFPYGLDQRRIWTSSLSHLP